jgi:hypothetical protein
MISSMSKRSSVVPSRSRLPWQVVGPWGVALIVLVTTALVAFLPRAVDSDPAPPGTTGALVWGDGVFANKLELEAWLRIRGVSYESWARKHPAAVKLLEKQ